MANRKPKTPKAPGVTRAILASNLRVLIEQHYSSLPNLTQRQRALEKDSGVRFSTIQRLMNKQTGANLESLEKLAQALKVSPDQLLRAEPPRVIRDNPTERETVGVRKFTMGSRRIGKQRKLKRA